MDAILDSIDPIAGFYTEHPYPPPVENLDRARDEWRDPNRARAEYHLFWPSKPYKSQLEILVAGCGTWQAPKYALCHPDAHVVGIDVSTTSLVHSEKLKQKYNLNNLELRQLPIEEVGELDHQFDLVVCTGVLHHLEEPGVGLEALKSVLSPEGAIYLMVYAPYGRAGVYMIQEYCRRLGIGTSGRDVNDLATVVEAMPQQHPLVSLLRGARDAQNTDALADALLNPRDQSYSVPQLFELIEQNDLKLKRWYWQAPYSPLCGSIATTPHAKKLSDFPASEQCVAMELFRGTMTTHSVILQHTNAQDDDVQFEGQEWLQYVPIRLPHTLCVKERLPNGVAGALLNRSHPFPDLVLPIDQEEKRMIELVNGKLTVQEIVDQSQSTTLHAYHFFQELWAYDQIVFDTSNS